MKETSPSMHRFNRSFHFDQRLYAVDIQCSNAYAQALQHADVITSKECRQIIKGLNIVKKEFDNGTFPALAADEDIHMAIERRLVELIGDAGQKLASGRSRNDQVATDERLFLRNAVNDIISSLCRLQKSLVNKASQELTTILPGYTHLQQAQPVFLSHYLLSFFFGLERDKKRLRDCQERMNLLPLGAGAFAGNPYPIDQKRLAKELGFDGIEPNSIDAVSDRDALIEFTGSCAIIMIHLSRYAEDFIIWSTREFYFIELDDAYTTGSSLMPQKKNPDALELIRGKTGRIVGHYVRLCTAMKGIPLTYSKDMQEDKEPLFDTIDTVTDCLNIFADIIETTSFRREVMRAKIDPAIMATDLADYLVKKGLPFRSSHHIIGRVIGEASQNNIPLNQLPIDKFRKHSPLFDNDVFSVFNPFLSANKRKGIGGTSQRAIRNQMRMAKKILNESKKYGKRNN